MRAEIERWQGALAQAWRAPRQADATPPSAPLLVGCEKTTDVAIHTSSSTACWFIVVIKSQE